MQNQIKRLTNDLQSMKSNNKGPKQTLALKNSLNEMYQTLNKTANGIMALEGEGDIKNIVENEKSSQAEQTVGNNKEELATMGSDAMNSDRNAETTSNVEDETLV